MVEEPKLVRVTQPTKLVLSLFRDADQELWGLYICRETGLKPGTLYPILDRLSRIGILESRWEEDDLRSGPRRKLYHLRGGSREYVNSLLDREPSTVKRNQTHEVFA